MNKWFFKTPLCLPLTQSLSRQSEDSFILDPLWSQWTWLLWQHPPPNNLIHFWQPPSKKTPKNKNKPPLSWQCLDDPNPNDVSFSVSDPSSVLFKINVYLDVWASPGRVSPSWSHLVHLVPFFISHVILSSTAQLHSIYHLIQCNPKSIVPSFM